jgi:hypothetical protein
MSSVSFLAARMHWPSQWPNAQTAFNFCKITLTSLTLATSETAQGLFIKAMKSNLPITVLGVLIVRPINIYFAYKEKQYYKIALDIMAFVAFFFFPYGSLVSIAIDVGSELINLALNWNAKSRQQQPNDFEDLTKKLGFNSKLPDPKIRENALKILNLSEKEIENLESFRPTFQGWIQDLERRKSKVSDFFVWNLNNHIEAIKQAYITLGGSWDPTPSTPKPNVNTWEID